MICVMNMILIETTAIMYRRLAMCLAPAVEKK